MPFLVCKVVMSSLMEEYADQHPESVKQCAKTPGVRCERCGVFCFRSVVD
jgi:hypothetical protein